MYTIRFLLPLLVLATLASGCASQKSRENRSAFNRFYHNETAYYNGYFNANVLFEQSKARLSTAHQDNYIRVLDVYEYVNVPSPEVVAADVDKAVEKLSVVVALHKHSVWTDDSYLLVGKAQYLKQDYESAEETLEYLREVYSPEAMAQRKNKTGRKARTKAKQKERAAKKKQVEKERAVKKKAADKVRKDKQKDAKSKAKERVKEAKRKQKERQKEAKARAKARKKGQKVPARQKVPTPSDSETMVTPDQPQEPAAPLQEEPPVEEPAADANENEAIAEDEGPPKREKYFLKHRPCYAEGLLWLGRTYTERQLYDDALRSFNQAAEQPSASDKVLREVPVAQAHLFLKQEQYQDAIPYLNLAIARANKRKVKARYYYVLGQIHQREGRLAEAAESFRMVRKMRPGYEMDFNARLNLTLSSWLAGRTPSAEARRELEKMLKDKKNLDYKDRIYFALAELDLQERDTAMAIVHLTESLGYNPVNKAQRAETQLKLADLYYAQERYIEAKTFYEQCLENLLVTDDRYPRVSRLSRNLTEIARNLQVIHLQDSLLHIAGLSEKERIELAEEIKAQRVAKAMAAKDAQAGGVKGQGQAQAQQVGLNAPQARGGAPAGAAKSTFFAYDPKTLDRGLKDFRKQWGERPLSDSWRQSSRSLSFAVDEASGAEEIIETRLTKSELQAMFKDVPFEEEAALAARDKIQDAMINLGRLYRERLEYPEKTIEVLNELLTRFPESEHELDAWYFLYLAHSELQQKAEAKRYFDLITGKYPESTYARVLTDPSYLGEAEEKERRLNQYYQTSFDMFQSGRYSAVWRRLSDVDSLFGRDNRLQTKFALLKAMTTGNIEGKDAYIDALKDLVAKFPNTEEEKRAKEILRLLGDKSVAPKALPGQVEPDSEFALDPEGVHYVIINWNLSDVGLEDAQKAVNNFNNTYFKADRLRLSANIFLNVDVPLMVIRKFDNAAKAMEFYRLAMKYPDQFIGKAGVPVRVYPVTQQNYRVVLKNRSLEAYNTYFQANYN